MVCLVSRAFDCCFRTGTFNARELSVVLAFNDEIVAQLVGDGLRLTEISAAIGAGVYLDQANDIRINSGDKADYSLQVDSGPFEKTGKRQREMVAKLMAGAVSDIVEK